METFGSVCESDGGFSEIKRSRYGISSASACVCVRVEAPGFDTEINFNSVSLLSRISFNQSSI